MEYPLCKLSIYTYVRQWGRLYFDGVYVMYYDERCCQMPTFWVNKKRRRDVAIVAETNIPKIRKKRLYSMYIDNCISLQLNLTRYKYIDTESVHSNSLHTFFLVSCWFSYENLRFFTYLNIHFVYVLERRNIILLH